MYCYCAILHSSFLLCFILLCLPFFLFCLVPWSSKIFICLTYLHCCAVTFYRKFIYRHTSHLLSLLLCLLVYRFHRLGGAYIVTSHGGPDTRLRYLINNDSCGLDWTVKCIPIRKYCWEHSCVRSWSSILWFVCLWSCRILCACACLPACLFHLRAIFCFCFYVWSHFWKLPPLTWFSRLHKWLHLFFLIFLLTFSSHLTSLPLLCSLPFLTFPLSYSSLSLYLPPFFLVPLFWTFLVKPEFFHQSSLPPPLPLPSFSFSSSTSPSGPPHDPTTHHYMYVCIKASHSKPWWDIEVMYITQYATIRWSGGEVVRRYMYK